MRTSKSVLPAAQVARCGGDWTDGLMIPTSKKLMSRKQPTVDPEPSSDHRFPQSDFMPRNALHNSGVEGDSAFSVGAARKIRLW